MKFLFSIRTVLVASTIAMLGACSAIKLGYNNAQTVAYTYLNSKVDFNDEQAAFLKTSLAEFMQWHRTTELPGLSREMQAISRQLEVSSTTGAPGAISHAQVQQVYALARNSLQRTANHAAPIIARNLLKLGSSQLQDIQVAIDKSNTDYRKEYLDESQKARHEKLVDRTIDRYENWLGKLDARQKTRIARWAHADMQFSAQRYSNRLQRQEEFMKLARQAVNRQISQEELSMALAELLNAWQNPRTSAEKTGLEARQKAAVDLAVDILNSASDDQRRHAAKRAANWAEDFQILAKG